MSRLTTPPWRRNGRAARTEAFSVRPIDTSQGITSLTHHRQAWQDEAWDDYRDNVGEFAAVTNWRANAVSKANLFVGRITDDSSTQPAPSEDPLLEGLLKRLGTGGATGYSQLLKRLSIHLDVPGESILVGTETSSGQAWFVASPDQITTWGGNTAVQIDNSGLSDDDYIQIPRADPYNPTPPTTVLRRIYEPDPRQPWLAISPARYARKPLRILNRLTDRVNANTLSRLMNKLMLISGDVTLPVLPDRADLHADPQLAGLIYGASQAIENPESPAAVLPIIGRAMGDIANKIELIDFGTSFDEQLVPMFNLFIRRLALMLDVPPEIMLGIGDASTYANALIVTEDAVKVHITPTLDLIADALTRAYLRPAIIGLNKELNRQVYDPDAYTVWYDTVRITERPNRAEDAFTAYAAGAINETALRRAIGADTEDTPTPADRRNRILLELAMKGVPIAEAEPYLRAMGISLDAPANNPAPAAPDDAPPGPPLPTPSATVPAARPVNGAPVRAPGSPAVPPGAGIRG